MSEVRKGDIDPITISELIQKCDIPRDQYMDWHRLRVKAMSVALAVFEERAGGYNVDHQAFQEQVYGPVSLIGEIYKRARRIAALLNPMRTEALNPSEVNRILDGTIDLINYLSWLYALIVLGTGAAGHENFDDAPDFLRDGEVHLRGTDLGIHASNQKMEVTDGSS